MQGDFYDTKTEAIMDQVPADLPAGDAMNIGVLLVSCKDSGRVTTLSRDWIHLAVGHAAGYFLRMSGGRQKIAFRVYEWHQLDMTSDGWNAAGLQVGDTVIPAVAKGLHADLSHHDHFAIVIDKFDAKIGRTCAWKELRPARRTDARPSDHPTRVRPSVRCGSCQSRHTHGRG